MSQRTQSDGEQGAIGVESGIAALQSSPTFRGPVEPHEGHRSNDHLALIYRNRDEQFGAAVPFLLEGLERGERCMHIVGDGPEEALLGAMRDADRDVDVDAALESGDLTLHAKDETYCRDGAFDADGMIQFLSDAIDEALASHEGLRVGSDVTWVGDALELSEFMAYEEQVNELFDGTDCVALCQYDRTRLSPALLRDVIRTHPHLVYDETVSHNYYYTPPEEFFGPDRPRHEVERMLNSLRDRTTATVNLRERERQLRRENARLESFASMLAHELRNPLSIAQIYHQRAVDGDREAAEEVAAALDRIEEMIDVLLVTARSADSVVDREPVALADVAAAAWSDLSPDEADLVVETDRTVRADSIHLQHLLKNLFENAVQHGDGSVTVRVADLPDERTSDDATGASVGVSAEQSEARQEAKRTGGGFAVADDGPGIPEAERDAVFEAGYTTESGGIGLGLTFVAQLAEMYDWDCRVTESDEGGARFEFRNVDESSPTGD